MVCKKCGYDKEIHEFYDIKHSKLCKECHKQRQRDYNRDNKQKCNMTSREYYQKNKDAHRDYGFKTRYGISLEEYNLLLEKQGGVCAICKRPETNKKRKYLSVDHDHETGKVRGLLCSNCNRGIGCFKENPSLLFLSWIYVMEAAKE